MSWTKIQLSQTKVTRTKKLTKRLSLKQNPRIYGEKNAQPTPSLRTGGLIGLRIGVVAGTTISTLPGIMTAEHTGSAAPLVFIVAVIDAGLSALAYVEASSVLPFTGSVFSWISVLSSESLGWIAG